MSYVSRHVGMSESDRAQALRTIEVDSVEALVETALPADIRLKAGLVLPPARSEEEITELLHRLAAKNTSVVPMYGMGFFPTLTPAVLRRNVLENPAWYTAYTPYQPEISQGRLEVLMAFQTMVADLMGLPLANASLLDEATAAAEAVGLARRATKTGNCVIVDSRLFLTSADVIRTRCIAMGIKVEIRSDLEAAIAELDPFCVVVAQFGVDGQLRSALELTQLSQLTHSKSALMVVASDLLACTMITPPGECGADVAIGSAQRLGIPLWYGGPSAGFMAVRQGLERQLPGRLVGLSKDADGYLGYRLAMQTREQHIRREKATSNICTSQVLLAVTAAFYAMWHGPRGLRSIAEKIHSQAVTFAEAVNWAGYKTVSDDFFDTVVVEVGDDAIGIVNQAHQRGIGLRLGDRCVGVTFGEGISDAVMADLAQLFELDYKPSSISHLADHHRDVDYLSAAVFNKYHSETAMMRYMRSLSERDYALDKGMIPLGSCTMKLNPAVAMEAISLPGFTQIHPFAPLSDAAGFHEIMNELADWITEITGFDAVCFQPNAGSQGEFAGLAAIRRFHDSNNDSVRRICLIPTSAHGTNAASAVMAGFKVVPVSVTADGSIDIADLSDKVTQYRDSLAALMVTYPSTHGVYEEGIRQISEIVHQGGGQVYIDGANLNALIGLVNLNDLGADASHLNLHKSFAMPHGGGGPGVGPLVVKSHLASCLPGHRILCDGAGAVSSAPYGSAGILPIAYAYIAMMGADGLLQATIDAVIEANYISARLKDYYPTLFTGTNGRVAHECILDLNQITHDCGVSAEDVAKRLIDYGFHAPTMSFPVPGTLMVEPTESESLAEIDRFCDAMIAIRSEIDQVKNGIWPIDDNPLCNAPHPAHRLVGQWDHPYSREQAAYPIGVAPGPILDRGNDKYWPPVGRIDQAYGDRNLVARITSTKT